MEKKPRTTRNLADAFSGEAQARARYMAFARKAEADGLTKIAKLFREIADQEFEHANEHLRCLGMVKSTLENLEAAVQGETYEFTEMYPKMVKEAKEDGDEWAVFSFTQAMEAEKKHADKFKKAIEMFKQAHWEKDVEI